MYRMKKCMIPIMAVFIALVGCTQEETGLRTPENGDGLSRIKSLMTRFVASTRGDAADDGSLEIVRVTTRFYDAAGEEVMSGVHTRAVDIVDAFPLSTVVFNSGDEMGYCLLSDDSRLNDVYFFTMAGNVSDTAYNEPLREYINAVPRMAASELSGGIVGGDYEEAKHVGPLVKYRWGQGYPFNIVAPMCTGPVCSNNEFQCRQPVGCGPLALAEFFATTRRLGQYSIIDFDNLPISNEEIEIDQLDNIMNFMNQMTNVCGVQFGCTCYGGHGSGISEDGFYKMYQFLIGLKYQVDYSPNQDLDVNKLYKELKVGAPHIMGGLDKNDMRKGHAWLIDGLREYANGYMYHCVWGWNGSSDGWIKGSYYSPLGSGYEFSKRQYHIYVTGPILGYINTNK